MQGYFSKNPFPGCDEKTVPSGPSGLRVPCPKFQVLLCRPDAPEVDEEHHRRNIDARLPKVQRG